MPHKATIIPLRSFWKFNLSPLSDIHPCCLAGLPYTKAYGRTSLVTTEPAPMNANSPITIPHTIVEFAPIVAPFLTRVELYSSSFYGYALLGYMTLVKTAEGPQKTLSSSVTFLNMETLF